VLSGLVLALACSVAVGASLRKAECQGSQCPESMEKVTVFHHSSSASKTPSMSLYHAGSAEAEEVHMASPQLTSTHTTISTASNAQHEAFSSESHHAFVAAPAPLIAGDSPIGRAGVNTPSGYKTVSTNSEVQNDRYERPSYYSTITHEVHTERSAEELPAPAHASSLTTVASNQESNSQYETPKYHAEGFKPMGASSLPDSHYADSTNVVPMGELPEPRNHVLYTSTPSTPSNCAFGFKQVVSADGKVSCAAL